MTVANGVLVTDHTIDLREMGIDTLKPNAASDYFLRATPSVVALHVSDTSSSQLKDICDQLQDLPKAVQFILINDAMSTPDFCDWVSRLRPFRLLNSLERDSLMRVFQETFRMHYELDQTKILSELIQQKNDELKRLSIELENKVTDRQKLLEESINKNRLTEKRLRTLKKTIVQIYQAESLSEIEHGILECLKSEFDISRVRIRQNHQSNLKDQKGIHQIRVPLKIGKRDFGHLILQSLRPSAFAKEERRFFHQIAESVALSIEKSFQIQKEQDLSLQWEATFDAISDPVCLTDSKYNILRVNKAFHSKVDLKEENPLIYGKKCYEILFGRDTVCDGCTRGIPFQLKSENRGNEVYDVHSNTIQDQQGVTYFQIYRNVTQSLNLERQVIESAKMAELGTISSSIAHELNNPIGGMLNFLQLMKMDLDGSEPYYKDIKELEDGTQKCKTIVQNLLGFSRKSSDVESENLNLSETLDQAINITELKTRSIGIVIERKYAQESFQIHGWFNLLAHTFRNILQNAQESIIEKRKTTPHYKGRIDVVVEDNPKAYIVRITDDGEGINKDFLPKIFDPLFTTKDPKTNSGLGLTLAQQIVDEHQGRISVKANDDGTITVEVLLNKAEVQSGS